MSSLREDPVLRNARREACLALGMWLVAMIYTITYCYLHGYGRAPESLTFVLWFPDWVFWGIVVPWGVCATLSTIFALFIMGEESLGDDPDAAAESGAGPQEARHG